MTLRGIFRGLCVAALSLAGAGCIEKVVDPDATAVTTDPAPAASVQDEAALQQAIAAEPGPVAAEPAIDAGSAPVEDDLHALQASVDRLCEQIGNKLSSVSIDDCAQQHFIFGGSFSVNQRPLVIKELVPEGEHTDFRVLIMGGLHGDEYSSISILFKWLALFSPDATEGGFHWRFAPLVNPDGLLDGSQAKRQNANGVDLNRNFPSRDWNDTAARYWQESTGSNPRRFPGQSAASEPEVQWVVRQIEEFQPDVIVSVHAPYHLLDFDGPAEAPARIGELYLHQLGVYPGSLGNFAGLNRQIPVVTLELPSAGIMPPAEQIDLMWKDLVAWLDREGRKGLRHL
jgi:protein MpaA